MIPNYYRNDAGHDMLSIATAIMMCFAFSIVGILLSFVPTGLTLLALNDYTNISVQDFKWIVVGFWAAAGVFFGSKFALYSLNSRRKDLRECRRLRCPVCGSEDIRFKASANFNPNKQSFYVTDVNPNIPHECRGCANEIMVEFVPMYPELEND